MPASKDSLLGEKRVKNGKSAFSSRPPAQDPIGSLAEKIPGKPTAVDISSAAGAPISSLQISTVNEVPPRCPDCGSSRIWKNGLRYARSETGSLPVQRFICRDCGRRFSEDNGLGSYLEPNRHVFNRSSGLSTCQVSVSEREMKNLSRQRTRIKKQAAGATELSKEDIKGKLIEYSWYLKEQGYSAGGEGLEGTIQKWTRMLSRLVKLGANLYDPKNVKNVIARQENWSEGTKVNVKCAYQLFLEMEGLTWKPPRYKQRDTVPWVPLKEEIDQLIHACGKKISIFLHGLKETGADPGELWRVEWTDINEKAKTVTINHPVKGHNSRILPISRDFIERLHLLPKESTRIFPVTMSGMRSNFCEQRKQKAKKLNNPRLLKLSFTSIRHWKATTEYHKTKDILHVKRMLGHKTLQSTMIYIDIERAVYGQLKDEEFTTRVAHTVEEDRELIEAGFEYVTERQGTKIYRKRK